MNTHLSAVPCTLDDASLGVRCSPGGGSVRGTRNETGAVLEALFSLGVARVASSVSCLAFFAAGSAEGSAAGFFDGKADETAALSLPSVGCLTTVRSRGPSTACCAGTETPVKHSNKTTAPAVYDECRILEFIQSSLISWFEASVRRDEVCSDADAQL